MHYGEIVIYFQTGSERVATIRDVAKLAGVSIATVSRVINKKGYVREETIQLVEKAISQLRYRPNAASAEPIKVSPLIAVFVDDFAHLSYANVLPSIEIAAHEEGFEVFLWNIQNQKSMEAILHMGVAGILVTESAYECMKAMSFSVPYMVLKEPLESYYEGSSLATTYLLERDVKFPAFLMGDTTSKMQERLEAFLDMVEDKRIPYRLIEAEPEIAKAQQAVTTTLRGAPYIDAIIASSEMAAIGAIRAAHSLHIPMPDRLQVIAFDGSQIGEYVYPSLTTVQTNSAEETKYVVKQLVQQIKQISVPISVHHAHHYIIERDSTKQSILQPT